MGTEPVLEKSLTLIFSTWLVLNYDFIEETNRPLSSLYAGRS
jgi:hypothetical protein